MPKNKEFHIVTRRGFFIQPEKLGSYSFPMSLCGSYQGATIYFSKLFAQKAIKFYKLENCFVEERD